MAEGDEPHHEGERELADRQGAGLYPIGRALRATYDADNHDSLGSDLTGLMLELTRLGEPPAPPAAAAIDPARKRSWLARLFGNRRS